MPSANIDVFLYIFVYCFGKITACKDRGVKKKE